MFLLLIFIIIFWLLMVIGYTNNIQPCFEKKYFQDDTRSQEREHTAQARGYYGGVGYPYLPFLEPLNLLAGLAFLAFLIQTIHAVYYYHHGFFGGLGVGSLVPARKRLLQTEQRNAEDVLKAIHFHEYANRRKKRRKNKREDKNRKEDKTTSQESTSVVNQQ